MPNTKKPSPVATTLAINPSEIFILMSRIYRHKDAQSSSERTLITGGAVSRALTLVLPQLFAFFGNITHSVYSFNG